MQRAVGIRNTRILRVFFGTPDRTRTCGLLLRSFIFQCHCVPNGASLILNTVEKIG